jgi:WS/DGAT/MGAT family acyltransferase
LAEIKAVGQALACSVNDLLLAAAAGAMRSHLVNQGDSVEGAEIRAMVPVNLRQSGDREELGNHFGLVALELPLGSDNPLVRLHATRARMAALKSSYQAMLTFALLAAAGMAPRFIEDQILRLLTSKTTAVMTNVPGSPQARFLAGCRIAEQLAWVPQAGDIGIGVSILSYDGRVQFGLITDRNMVDNPQSIADQFGREFEKFLWLALLETPDRLTDPLLVADDMLALSSRRAGRQAP